MMMMSCMRDIYSQVVSYRWDSMLYIHVVCVSQTHVCVCLCASLEWLLQRIREWGHLPVDASQRSLGPQCLLYALLLLAARHRRLLPVAQGEDTPTRCHEGQSLPHLTRHTWPSHLSWLDSPELTRLTWADSILLSWPGRAWDSELHWVLMRSYYFVTTRTELYWLDISLIPVEVRLTGVIPALQSCGVSWCIQESSDIWVLGVNRRNDRAHVFL